MLSTNRQSKTQPQSQLAAYSVQAGLDSTTLVDFFIRNGLTPSTQRSYSSAKRFYLSFCHAQGLVPTPASEHQLCLYVSSLAPDNLCHNTICLQFLHIAESLGDPHICKMARLEQVLWGIKSTQAKRNIKGKPRLPITTDHLQKMRSVWLNQASRDEIMLWAAASLWSWGVNCSI